MSIKEPEKKKFKHSMISERINSEEFKDLFCRHWHNREPLETEDLCVITEPYRLCKIKNFLEHESFMEDLKNELADVKSRRQSMDLYQFEQTSDLGNVDSENLGRLWSTFQSDFATWIETNTRIELNKKISMSSSVYYDTDYLLCHDDNMGDRRIAFVLYLSKDWSPEDGGSLDLFDTDENGAPRSVVRSLVPEYNSLVFFEVHDDSYHQVSEVKSSDKSRWTINGWFHGPVVPSTRKPRSEAYDNPSPPSFASSVDLKSWIRGCYLDAGVAKNVQKNVEANSYTFLSNFFINETYEVLSSQVASEDIVWRRVGPPDVRNYEIAEVESLPENLLYFYRLFGNIEMFELLKRYTELDLVPNVKEEGDPSMSIQLERWSSGCYTLMRDKSLDESEDERAASMSFQRPVTPMSQALPRASSLGNRPGRNEPKEEERDNRRETKEVKRGKKEQAKKPGSPSPSSTDESVECAVLKRLLKAKGRVEKKSISLNLIQQASCSSIDDKSTGFNPESEDSDVSDIGDYLSDRFERSIDNSDEEEEEKEEEEKEKEEEEEEEDDDDDGATSPSTCEPGSLDVIVQFNTCQVPADETIDYIDPNQQEGALIHVPFRDNHLCLAYKTLRTSRLQKYVNHYFKGYFYNLICTYYE